MPTLIIHNKATTYFYSNNCKESRKKCHNVAVRKGGLRDVKKPYLNFVLLRIILESTYTARHREFPFAINASVFGPAYAMKNPL